MRELEQARGGVCSRPACQQVTSASATNKVTAELFRTYTVQVAQGTWKKSEGVQVGLVHADSSRSGLFDSFFVAEKQRTALISNAYYTTYNLRYGWKEGQLSLTKKFADVAALIWLAR